MFKQSVFWSLSPTGDCRRFAVHLFFVDEAPASSTRDLGTRLIKQYFHVVLFIMLRCKKDLAF